jgi:hypothetical protein
MRNRPRAHFFRAFLLTAAGLVAARAASAQITLPACSGSAVALRAVCEVRLKASTAYGNPFTNAGAQVTADFTHSNPNVTLRVSGFWDGNTDPVDGRTIMTFRFTPTESGSWSYLTTSADSALHGKTGNFSVTGSGRGFLRRNNNRPEQFVFDNNIRYFMWGQTYYNIVNTARFGGPWKNAVDQSALARLNKVRLLAYPFQDSSIYPNTKPFADANHTVLDAGHFRKLDEVVHYLNNKGMVADLIVFSTNCDSFAPPLYSAQGATRDERYLRYVVARYAAFPNVIWCLTNEWQLAPFGSCNPNNNNPYLSSYWETLGGIVRNEDPWITNTAGNRLRPLSIHQRTQHTFDLLDAAWVVHAVLQDGTRNGRFDNPDFTNGDEWGNYGIRANLGHGKPVVNDEYGYFGENLGCAGCTGTFDRLQNRRTIWGIALAGGYGSSGDFREMGGPGSAPILSATWQSAMEYDDLGRLIQFFTTRITDWWLLASDPSVTSTSRTYGMSQPGVRYLVYSATGGSFTVNLAALPPGGVYKVARYNPATGQECSLPDRAGGSQSFSLPASDWVLRLETSGPVLTACP